MKKAKKVMTDAIIQEAVYRDELTSEELGLTERE